MEGWLSCLDHQQPCSTVSPSSQHPLIVFPLRTDGVFVLCAPSCIPAGGHWMVGGFSGWDDCLCLSEDRIGSCLLRVGVFMRGGEWFCLRPVWSASSFSSCLLHAHYQSSFCCEMRSRLRKSTDGSAAFYRKLCFLSCDWIDQEFGWLFDSLNMTSSLDWGDDPSQKHFSECVSSVFGFSPLVSIAAGLNAQGRSCGTDQVIRSHSVDFDCVTDFFIFGLDNVQ